MKITWRDEDGDDVSIESDEELLIALHEMKGKVWFKMVQNGPKWSKMVQKWFGPNWIRSKQFRPTKIVK